MNGSFRDWCYKTLPLVYDDSLSYYNMLCKLMDVINKAIQNLLEQGADISALQDRVTALEKYFDSEDFLGDVENILNNMAESGKLDSIMTEIVQAENAVLKQTIEKNAGDIALLKTQVAQLQTTPPGELGTDATVDEYGFVYESVFQRFNNQINGLHYITLTSEDADKYFTIPSTGLAVAPNFVTAEDANIYFYTDDSGTGKVSKGNWNNGAFIPPLEGYTHFNAPGIPEGQSVTFYWGKLDYQENRVVGCPMSTLTSGTVYKGWVGSSSWCAYLEVPLGLADNVKSITAGLEYSIYLTASRLGQVPTIIAEQLEDFSIIHGGYKHIDLTPYHGKGLYLTALIRNDVFQEVGDNNTFTRFYRQLNNEAIYFVEWVNEPTVQGGIINNNLMHNFNSLWPLLPDLTGFPFQRTGLATQSLFFNEKNAIFYGGDFYTGCPFYNMPISAMLGAMKNPNSLAYHTQFDDANSPNGFGFVCSSLTAFLIGEPCPRSVTGFIYGDITQAETEDFSLEDFTKLKPGDILIQEERATGHCITVERVRYAPGSYLIDCLESTIWGTVETCYMVEAPFRANNGHWFGLAFDHIAKINQNVPDRTEVGSWIQPYTDGQKVMCNRGYGGLYLKGVTDIYLSFTTDVTDFSVFLNDNQVKTSTVSILNPVSSNGYNVVNVKELLSDIADGTVKITANGSTEMFYLMTASKNVNSITIGEENVDIDLVNNADNIGWIDVEYRLAKYDALCSITYAPGEYTVDGTGKNISVPAKIITRDDTGTAENVFVVNKTTYDVNTYWENDTVISV